MAVVFCCFSGPAQSVSSPDDYVVQVWDTDSGLPHSTVTGVRQTADGYLWISTLLGGLARFDGAHFKDFHPGNTPELKSIEIHKLLTDGDGTLWIGGVDGSVDSYKNGEFSFEFANTATPASWLEDVVSLPHKPIILSSHSGKLFSRERVNGTNLWQAFQTPDFGGDLCADPDGVIWYRTSSQHLAKIIDGKVVRVDNPPGLQSPIINRLLVDDQGHLWAGTEKEIAVWDGKTFRNMTPTNDEPRLAVRDLTFCPDGTLWVRTDDRLRKCAGQKWLTEAKPWTGQFPYSTHALRIHGDSRGGVWLIHYGLGLWHVDGEGRVSQVGEQQGLPSGLVECWCEDREGNFWVGLRDGGLARVHSRIFHEIDFPDGWGTKSTRSLCEDDEGAMWFGLAGPTVLRLLNGEFDSFTPPANPFPGTETAVLPGGPKQLWVGTVRNGLWQWTQGKFTRPFSSDNIDTVVRCLATDHTGTLWIGSEYGLFRWQNGKLKRFTTADGFSPAYVLSIAEDPAGDIWIGTGAGELRRWHQGKFESFWPPDMTNDPNWSQAASKTDQPSSSQYSGALFGRERFWALHFDSEGTLWIGTLGGGLLRFKQGHFTRFTTQDGLPSEHVSQMLEDDYGNLWLGTRAGICRVKKSDLDNYAGETGDPLNFITYGRGDGLPSLECSGGIQPACWKGRDGQLWFSTTKGPVWVNPAALRFNRLPPPVQLEAFLVDNKPISLSAGTVSSNGSTSDRIQVAPGRHYFDFKFTALSFSSPDKVKFKWRLKGLETKWVDGGNRRDVSYSFLQAGNYRFEVQACNNDGVWNQTGASVDFTVRPFFWQEWWFKFGTMGCGLAICLTIVLSVQRRRYHARMRILQRQQDLEQERARIARDIHDQIGASLTKIGMQTKALENQPNLISTSRSLVQGVAESAREMLQAMDETVWTINPCNDNLENSINYIIHYTRDFLRPAAISYRLDVPTNLPNIPFTTELRHNLFLAFKEALNNAVKHGHPDRIVITLALEPQQLTLTIEDSGCGFSSETDRTGADGLKNMRLRLATIGGVCKIDSIPGQGTKVVFQVPLPAKN